MRTPKKLHSDSIVDAVGEIRFNSGEGRDAPEIVVGLLASKHPWRSYRRNRLPEADIPEFVRKSDPNLFGRALLELEDAASGRKVRVGTNSISTHRVGRYPGWEMFFSEIKEVAESVFECLTEVSIDRIGLRYINVLRPRYHHVSAVHDLDFSVRIKAAEFNGALNLNYMVWQGNLSATIRIASPEFIQNLQPSDAVGVVDLDVTAKSFDLEQSAESVVRWFVEAHDFEKRQYFGLFPEALLKKNVEVWERTKLRPTLRPLTMGARPIH